MDWLPVKGRSREVRRSRKEQWVNKCNGYPPIANKKIQRPKESPLWVHSSSNLVKNSYSYKSCSLMLDVAKKKSTGLRDEIWEKICQKGILVKILVKVKFGITRQTFQVWQVDMLAPKWTEVNSSIEPMWKMWHCLFKSGAGLLKRTLWHLHMMCE